MSQVAKQTRWSVPQWLKDFADLQWYDASISFLFRFVAKTSEPLLAAGVIVSAADFLQHGRLMRGNVGLENTWAWTQALAIEASTGPVLVFALQAFRAKDSVKGWLYAVLAGLLFFVGGSMLLLQLISRVSGQDEANINMWVIYGLFLLRVIVSGGMVALTCTKRIRFSGSEKDGETPAMAQASDAMLATIQAHQERVDARLEAFQNVLEQVLSAQIVVSEQRSEQELLPAPEGKQETNNGIAESLAYLADRFLQPNEQACSSPEQATNNGDRVRTYLEEYPDATVREVAEALGISTSTANKWMNKRVRHEQANN